MSSPRNVAVIVGSLRKESFNRKMAKAMIAQAPPALKLEIVEIGQLPHYNQDFDNDPPQEVKDFKGRIQQADAVLFVTPEYNHGVPGVMKNALDWASRPPQDAALARKPVGIIGASPGMTGSARGQSQLRQAFEFTNSYCMPQPELLVFKAHEKFDAQGRLTDEATAKYLRRYLAALLDWTRRFACA
jgi:chromate reductase